MVQQNISSEERSSIQNRVEAAYRRLENSVSEIVLDLHGFSRPYKVKYSSPIFDDPREGIEVWFDSLDASTASIATGKMLAETLKGAGFQVSVNNKHQGERIWGRVKRMHVNVILPLEEETVTKLEAATNKLKEHSADELREHTKAVSDNEQEGGGIVGGYTASEAEKRNSRQDGHHL